MRRGAKGIVGGDKRMGQQTTRPPLARAPDPTPQATRPGSVTEALKLQDGIGRKDLEAIRQRFFALHRERLRRILGELRASHQDFIVLLPLLFHINHPMLPGFVNTRTPAGLPNYSPTRAALRTARKISRSFAYKKRAQRRFRIQALYLMGSMGTIAQTAGSDFDVWLCHDPGLGGTEIQGLQEKATKIEHWAAELGVEVHIFVMNADHFRRGGKASLSLDSTGSTQHFLLLEEFYRTSVFLAGRYPLWWLVPPEQETNYSEYAAMLLHKRFVDHRECLDFGGLQAVPVEEFFGAALWQLFKGVDAPYKAVLKILLMEAYARDYPAPEWIAQQAKVAVYNGEKDVSRLDPYILLYHHVERHLVRQGETQRVELLRRCLYFKVGERLSRLPAKRPPSWRQEQMLTLTRQWSWSPADLEALDSRPHWKIDRVMQERNILVRELSHSYRILTEFARSNAKRIRIDPVELSLLGRKLYTALERRPGKVEHINPGISQDLVEPRLSLHYAQTRDGNQGWFLYRGQTDEDQARNLSPVKTTLSLIEMLAWCHVNGISNRDTVFSLYPEDGPVTFTELHAILDALSCLYPDGKPPKADLDDLGHPARALSSHIFVNVGTDPMEHLSREGKQLTSNRCDALSFGAAHANLAVNLEELISTSWGELLVRRYEGAAGMLDALCRYLGLTLLIKAEIPAPKIDAYSFSSIRARSIAGRVAQVFDDACRAFGPEGSGQTARYVLQVGDDLFVIQKGEQGFGWTRTETVDELTELLGEPQAGFKPVVMDRNALSGSHLPVLFEHNRPHRIQLYYRPREGQVDLFILDENGGLFHQTLRSDDHQQLLIQQQRFLNSMLRYRSLFVVYPGNEPLLEELEFFLLRRNRKGNWSAEPKRPPQSSVMDNYLELRLITSGSDHQVRPFALICGDEEFNVLEYGDALYPRVARHILGLRRGRSRYPIYLTAVETSDNDFDQRPSSIGILNLKKRVETRLNHALQEVGLPERNNQDNPTA